jgi:hypothetical protein
MPKVISKREISQGPLLTGWDKAILDAQKGIERLKRAIETCVEKKRAGEPWPGSIKGASTHN